MGHCQWGTIKHFHFPRKTGDKLNMSTKHCHSVSVEGGGRGQYCEQSCLRNYPSVSCCTPTHVTFDSILSETLCVSLSQFYSGQKYSHTFHIVSKRYNTANYNLLSQFSTTSRRKEQECVFTCSPDCSSNAGGGDWADLHAHVDRLLC